MDARLLILSLMMAALVPVAAAQDNDTTVNFPDKVDVDVTENDGNDADESVGFAGLSTTALIVLIVLAVLVIALVVALASRDRYP